MQIIRDIQKSWNEKPLMIIMIVAVLTRFLAVVFSRGFGMHDDHFLVIEAAQAWVDGVIVPGHLQGPGQELIPDGHSLFYMGLHFLLFKFMAVLGIFDPSFKMLVVRILHALASISQFGLRIRLQKSFQLKKMLLWQEY